MADSERGRVPHFLQVLSGAWGLFWRANLGKSGRWVTFAWVIVPPVALGILLNMAPGKPPENGYYGILAIGYLLQVVPLVCLFSFGGVIREEIRQNTMSFLAVRPVGRIRLLVAKYLSQLLWVQALLAVELCALMAVGSVSIEGVEFGRLGVFLGIQALGVLAWSAIATTLGLISKNYVPLGILYGVLVEKGIANIPTNMNTLAVTRNLQNAFERVPVFNEAFPFIAPAETATPELNILLLAGVFVALSAALYYFKEYLPSREFDR